jgi:hypothetical protein
MGRGVPEDAEKTFRQQLAQLQHELADAQMLDRPLVTLLAELIVTTTGALSQYRGDERACVASSAARIGEAVMAVLTPSDMPPLPD